MNEDKPEVSLAFLMLPRQTCVGCSNILYERGMLEIVSEIVRNVADGSSIVTRIYSLAPGVTLEECQAIVKDHHKGPRPWGLD